MAMEMDPEAGVRPLERTSSTMASATSLEWSSLSVTVKGKTVLQPTDGMLNAGDMLAVMGPSGCGKTTLLDAVSGRTRSHKLSGTVSFNGHTQVSFAQRSRVLSYVGQEDSLLGVFTVAETLRFAVRFYHGALPAHIPRPCRPAQLQSSPPPPLRRLFHQRQGDARARGGDAEARRPRVVPRNHRRRHIPQGTERGAAAPWLAGGAGHVRDTSTTHPRRPSHRRRLSLAVELVKRPAILLLDEPTSGLDSASAFGVMQRLKAMARAGHAIALTIHQPSSELWALFDNVLLLSGGHTLAAWRDRQSTRRA